MGAQWEMAELIQHLIKEKYGGSACFTVEMSTKRNSKAKWDEEGYHNKYTMYILKDKQTIAKSAEQKGHNKNYWSAEEYAKFFSTLELV